MGLRVRLKASVSLAGFGPQARTVLTALKRYGMILADNGSPWYVSGAPNAGWDDDDLHELRVTTPEAARATIAAHRSAFADAGFADAWPRALALVVQPGVEFDHHKVIDYQPDQARALSASIAAEPQFVCEAHSTDYQTPANLRALVRDHFAILKVGPAATFALRESSTKPGSRD